MKRKCRRHVVKRVLLRRLKLWFEWTCRACGDEDALCTCSDGPDRVRDLFMVEVQDCEYDPPWPKQIGL